MKVGDKVIQVTNGAYGVSKMGWRGIVTDIHPDVVYVLFDEFTKDSLGVKSEDLILTSDCMRKKRITFEVESSEGIKHDSEKVRMELLSPIALTEIAKVLTAGAKKYDSHNWRKGMAWSRLLGAALRHLLAFLSGEDKDPETSISHLAHLAACAMFLLEYEVTHKNLDDRYKPETKE